MTKTKKMKKATNFTLYLSLWIILLFGSAMIMTFINDWIQSTGFFGDIKRTVYKEEIDGWYDWGQRHYWYYAMCVLLFLISIVRIIMWMVHYWENKK